MLGYTVHDVRITRETRNLPPQDGWACSELTGMSHLTCSCGHTEGPIVNAVAPLTARQHILSASDSDYYQGTHTLPVVPGASAFPWPDARA